MIFVHDMERVFDRIERPAMEIIAGVVLLDYSIPEVALRIGITVQRAERRYAAALDTLSIALLEVGLLRPVFEHDEDHAYPLRPFAERLPMTARTTRHSYPFGSAASSMRTPLIRARTPKKDARPGGDAAPGGAFESRI